jgi:thiamine-phosphate pyrophosphorylase
LKPPRQPPLLYLITDRRAFLPKPDGDEEACRAQIEIIRLAAQNGVQLIQIREKDLSARALAEFTCQAIAVARPQGAKVLINDRLDVALATQADGVHLRTTSLAPSEVRRVTARRNLNDFLIGVSTHSLAEAQAAQAGGADFIVCGPVFETLSKREYGAPLGLDRFAEVCQRVSLPVLALGGITLANLSEPLQRGAAGIAAIGLFTKAGNLRQLPTRR